jgi:hypothetical protein
MDGAATSKTSGREATPPKDDESTNGSGPGPRILTAAEILERAPSDVQTKLVEVPEWAPKEGAEPVYVKIKTLTGAERARIASIGSKAGDAAWGEMEIQQFLLAVIEPRLDEHQVRQLYSQATTGFKRVIDAHDELSSMNKEELRQARSEFRQPEQR